MSSDQLETLEKAREELRKQFFSYAQSLSKGLQRAQTYEDVDGVIKNWGRDRGAGQSDRN